MKININFAIEYENPKTKNDYKKLLKVIRHHFENNMSIPCTEKILWKSIGEIGVSLCTNKIIKEQIKRKIMLYAQEYVKLCKAKEINGTFNAQKTGVNSYNACIDIKEVSDEPNT